MAVNKRVIFSIYACGIAFDGSSTYTPIHGLQSVGITTTFNLEQVFEIGQINIYQNIENLPDVEVTSSKVLDGYPPVYVLATHKGASSSLSGRSAVKCAMAMSIFDDVQDSASGTPQRQVEMSGLFVSSVSYNFPVEGNCTEDVTLVGNNKLWKSGSFTFSGQLFTNNDVPLSYTSGTGGVQRRQNVKFGGASDTLLPTGSYGGIPGISSSGTNDKTNDVYGAHVQGIRTSVNMGRDAILELGRRGPFFRPINAINEVTTEIDVLNQNGDGVSATEDGVVPNSGINLEDKKIAIKLDEGLYVDLGTRNKLQSVSIGGGSTGGENGTLTFSYSNFNFFTVTHPQSPGV